MPTLLRILTFAFGMSLACCVSAMQPPHNYSDKTTAELLELLENKDNTFRECAAIFLGERYRKLPANWRALVPETLFTTH